MARAGRVIRRKANGNGGRKRKARSKEDDVDDEDEEYVLGEDDAVESDSDCESDADSRDFSDEGSFEFSESDDDDDDEEKEIKIVRSKKKKNQRNQKKSRVSDDEIEDLNLSVPKRRGRAGPKKQKTKDSDYELDDEDDDDEEFLPDEDDFEEDDVLIVSKRKGGVKKERSKLLETKKRKMRNRMMEESDDDFIANDRVLVGRKRAKRKKTANKKRSSLVSESLDSDFGPSDDDFVLKHNNRRKDVNKVKKTAAGSKLRRRKTAREDSELSDSDFVISDDSDGDDFRATGKFVLEEQQKNVKKVKKTAGSNGRKKKKPTKKSVSSDSDFVISEEEEEDFDVNDQVVVYKQQMNSKKEKNMVSNKKRMRNRSSIVMESSDSDYLIYDDDDDDEFVVDEQRKKSKQLRETRTKTKRMRRRSSSLVDSGSESFDFDDVISEEEFRDLGVGGGFLSLEKTKRLVVGKKGEEKGKEKQANDSGLQVCGICLSEEKKSVVQGLLNCCFHYFCFACIMEWSKVESRCPVCKRRFETITKSGGSDPGFGMRNAVIRVQKRDQVYQPPEEELRGMLDPYENVVCMECQQGGDDNLMLLCDICDSSAHTYCVGLGREVPEGNWYCECCRSVNDGPSHSQFHDIMRDQVVGNGNLLHCINDRGGLNNLNVNMSSPRSVSVADRSSSLRIDLNSSPRDFPGDDHFVSSPATGSGASTVSGRRHIRQRIRVILSTNRQRQTAGGINMLDATSAANVARNGEPLPLSENRSPLSSVLSSEQWQQNPRPSFQSHTNLAPCMSIEGCSLRHVDGAKEEVQQMVKSHLKDLSRNRLMERSTFKKIERTSTHTILAACGIEHHRSMVSAAIEPPETCTHDTHDGPAHLLKGCCLSCFSSFVKDVVQRLVSTY